MPPIDGLQLIAPSVSSCASAAAYSPRPRRGERSFGAGMAAADNNDIETFGIKHGIGKLLEISGERGRILRQFAEK
jgi:hypothetical protein